MAQKEAGRDDIAQALVINGGEFDSKQLGVEVPFAYLSTRVPDRLCYTVADPEENDSSWVVAPWVFHQGVLAYYKSVASSLRSGVLDNHLALLDRALETDYAADGKLAGNHVWSYRTVGTGSRLELRCRVDLGHDTVISIRWGVGIDHVIEEIPANLSGQYRRGDII